MTSYSSGSWYLTDLTCQKSQNVDRLLGNLRIWIGNDLAPPSINRADLWGEVCLSHKESFAPNPLILVDCNVFLILHPGRGRKGKKWNVIARLWVFRSPIIAKLFAMDLSRDISFYNKTWLSGRIGKFLASTRSCSSDLWLNQSTSRVGIQILSFLMACWGRSGRWTRWMWWWLWFHRCLSYLVVFILAGSCCPIVGEHSPTMRNRKGVGVFLRI